MIISWKEPIKNFIFLTIEGFTFQPYSTSIEPDIENLQVIGFAQGVNAQVAFEHLLEENTYLNNTNFNEIFSMELAESCKKIFFSLKRYGE